MKFKKILEQEVNLKLIYIYQVTYTIKLTDKSSITETSSNNDSGNIKQINLSRVLEQ